MFEPIKITSRKQVMYDALKEAMFAGKLSPGDALVELHLANEFGVSQATVREALLQLEHVGLIVKIPNKGTFVKEISQNEIRERNEIRICLEEMACLCALTKMNEGDFAALTQLITQMKEAIADDQPLLFTKSDMEFHQYVWEKSENEILYDTLTRIVTPLFYISFNIQQMKHWTQASELLASHEKYLETLMHNDKEKIKTLIIDHVKDSVRPMS